MNYKIAVCDDSVDDRKYVLALLDEWLSLNGHTADVSEFDSAEAFLMESGADCDMLLLDVEMKTIDGVTLAKMLRRDNDAVQIIFITGYSDYIAEGYDVAALHYLLKPVRKEKLYAVLDRAAHILVKNEKMLTLEVSGGAERVQVRRIRYAEVFGNYVTLHADRELRVKMTLGELEGLLDDGFYRVGRSVIINLAEVSRVTRQSVTLRDGSVLPIPRGAYEGINRAIIQRI